MTATGGAPLSGRIQIPVLLPAAPPLPLLQGVFLPLAHEMRADSCSSLKSCLVRCQLGVIMKSLLIKVVDFTKKEWINSNYRADTQRDPANMASWSHSNNIYLNSQK